MKEVLQIILLPWTLFCFPRLQLMNLLTITSFINNNFLDDVVWRLQASMVHPFPKRSVHCISSWSNRYFKNYLHTFIYEYLVIQYNKCYYYGITALNVPPNYYGTIQYAILSITYHHTIFYFTEQQTDVNIEWTFFTFDIMQRMLLHFISTVRYIFALVERCSIVTSPNVTK